MESPLRKDGVRLIETLRWDGRDFVRLERHLARAERTAEALGFEWDATRVSAALQDAVEAEAARVRLTMGAEAMPEVTVAPLADTPVLWKVAIAVERVRSDDPWRRLKTTERGVYDRARAGLPEDVDEWLFLNEREELVEGTITNLFIDRGEGLETPSVSSGALPGCLRAELLETGQAREAVLKLVDLDGAELWMGNSLRGLIRVELV